ncbi:MAG: hypothetical protein Tsb0034_26210 [Ekhidna sp.]
MNPPLVSVICICHNHEKYVEDAIKSVFTQTYPHVELIVVDDASKDGSKDKIKKIVSSKNVPFISIDENVGNCTAFNRGFRSSKGTFIIDLAADDMLLPDRIEKGLGTFQQKNIGVEFCNVMHINEDGKELGPHFEKDQQVKEGDLYEHLIANYYVPPPGMMIRRDVLEALDGYDEHLSYEDFDFWIRSSRKFHYGYTNELLVKKRSLKQSLSKQQFQLLSKHQTSTLRVCEKIKLLNTTKKEEKALRKRCFYEIRQCMRLGNLHLIPGFLKLAFY